MAAHTGVEPVSSDRQSDIINRYTNEPLVLGMGVEPIFWQWKCHDLADSRTEHLVVPTRVELVFSDYQSLVLTIRRRNYLALTERLELPIHFTVTLVFKTSALPIRLSKHILQAVSSEKSYCFSDATYVHQSFQTFNKRSNSLHLIFIL